MPSSIVKQAKNSLSTNYPPETSSSTSIPPLETETKQNAEQSKKAFDADRASNEYTTVVHELKKEKWEKECSEAGIKDTKCPTKMHPGTPIGIE